MVDRLFQSKGSRIRFNYSNTMLASHSLGRMGQPGYFLPGESSLQDKRGHEIQQQLLPSSSSRPQKNYFKAKKEVRGLQLTTSKKVNMQKEKANKSSLIQQYYKEDQNFAQVRQLRCENNELIRRLLISEQIQSELKQKLQILQNSLQSYTSPQQILAQQRSSLEQSELREALEKQIRAECQQEFGRKIEIVQQERSNLKYQVSNQMQISSQAQSKMRMLEEQVAELTQMIQSMNKQSKKMQKLVLTLQNSLAEKEKLVVILQSENVALTNHRQVLSSDINRQLEIYNAQIFQLNNALESEQNNNISLRQGLRKAEQQIIHQTTAILQLSREKQASTSQRDALQKQFNELNISLSKALKEVEYFSRQSREQQLAVKESSVLKQSLNEWKMKVIVLQEEIQRLQLFILQLKSKYQALLNEVDKENNSIQKINATITQLQTAGNKSSIQQKLVLVERNQLQQSLTQTRQTIQILTRDNHQLKQLADNLRIYPQVQSKQLRHQSDLQMGASFQERSEGRSNDRA